MKCNPLLFPGGVVVYANNSRGENECHGKSAVCDQIITSSMPIQLTQPIPRKFTVQVHSGLGPAKLFCSRVIATRATITSHTPTTPQRTRTNRNRRIISFIKYESPFSSTTLISTGSKNSHKRIVARARTSSLSVCKNRKC